MEKCKKLTAFAPFLSVLVLVGCIVASLTGYEAAAYDVAVPEAVLEKAGMQSSLEDGQGLEEPFPEQNTEINPSENIGADEGSAIDLSKMADGKYEGEGTGFGGKIMVSVEIKDHKIMSVQILSASGEDVSFLTRAKGVIDKILAAQSLEVDTVSGATYSSRGIIRAVRNALSGETDDGKTASSSSGTGSSAGTAALSQVNEAGTYQDGVYEGSGKGFAGEIRVRVTITGGKIAAIEIISSSDGTSYVEKASGVITKIVNAQSTNVDAVSGATYSSIGIVSAVRDALSKAVAQAETEAEKEEPSATVGAFPYKDGIYYGTAAGFSGDLTVAVALQEKTIKAILVTKSEDDTSYLTRAKTVANEIITKQSTNVDTVSGATYSSKGILRAVKEALKAAKKGIEGKDGASGKEDGKEPENEGTATGKIPYKEGIYFGTGTGFQGDVEVAIAISDQTLKAIVITQTEDDEKFFNRARAVIDQVLKKQSTKVDAVSGATYSSDGILEAIQDALSKAKKATEHLGSENNPQDPSEETPGGDTDQPGNETPGGNTDQPGNETPGDNTERPGDGTDDSGGKIYRDGTYQVSALCYPDDWEEFDSYTLSATVTIKQDKIVSITNITGDGGSENNAFIKRAAEGTNKKPGVVAQIIEKGNTQGVDTVSAATCSSQAILDACSQALLKAKK